MTLRVLLIGQEAAGAQILRALAAASQHEVVAVLTQEPSSKGDPMSLAGVARALSIDVMHAGLVRETGFASLVRDRGVDVLLNVHSLHLVPDDVLEAPKIGAFNLHPGPLPEYAGLNTVGWAIYNGDAEYGVTVHWMVPRVDAGPIAFEARFPMDEAATALTLSAECTRRGVELLLDVLRCADAVPSRIPAHAQNLSRRRYYRRSSMPQEGRVDWSRSAAHIERLGRAFDYGPFTSPWGRLTTRLQSTAVEVAGLTRTGEPTNEPPGTPRLSKDGQLEVASADEWIRTQRLYVQGSQVEPSRLLEELWGRRTGPDAYP